MSFPQEWVQKYISGDPEVLAWYVCSPNEIIKRVAQRTKQGWKPLEDEELEEWVQFLNPYAPTNEVLQNLNKLAQPGVLAVVTGQQTGFAGGPLYTIYKAIGAVKWARKIEKEQGIPTVPVFWAASDDHDFEEVSWHKWLDAKGETQNWQIQPNPDFAGSPVFHHPIPKAEVEAFTKRFEETTPPGDHRDNILQLLNEISSLQPLNFETQFIACLMRWFGKSGLVPVVPRLNWLRKRSIPLIKEEIATAPQSSQVVLGEGDRLNNLGGKNQGIHRNGNELNLFYLHGGEGILRCKLTIEGDEYKAWHPVSNECVETFSREELLAKLKDSPDAFSPNAVLRPLVQDYVLPTAAYIGGPSELVYHAQLGALYEKFDVFRPALVPRPSALLLEPRVERLLKKLQLSPGDAIANGPDGLRESAAAASDEGGVRKTTDEQLRAIESEFENLMEYLKQTTNDTGLIKAVEKMQNGTVRGSEKVRERLDDFLRRQNDDAANQAERIIESFWPGGEPQERVLGALSPLLRTAGQSAIENLLEAVELEVYEEQVIHIASL